MEFNSKDIGWPEDTVILNYPHIPALQAAVLQLVITQHVFVVSPKNNAIAMSREAAAEIGVI